MAQRADRSYVTAIAVPGGGSGPRIGLQTFTRDGDPLSAGFGNNGRVLHDAGLTGIVDMIVDHADRIVVLGAVSVPNHLYDIAVVRFLPDGSLDTQFGENGTFVGGFDFDGPVLDTPLQILEQGSGASARYVVLSIPSPSANALRRVGLLGLTSAGTLDAGFGNLPVHPGQSQIAFYSDRHADPRAMALLGDGSIVVVGSVTQSANDTDVALRLLSPSGVATTNDIGAPVVPVDIEYPQGQTFDGAYAVTVDGAGRLVVGGNAGYRQIALRVRVNPSTRTLALDTTFAGAGSPAREHIFVGSLVPSYASDIAVRPEDGSVFLVGNTEVGPAYAGTVQQIFPEGGRGEPEDALHIHFAPTLANQGDSYATRFHQVLIDRARPLVFGQAPDSISSQDDDDGVLLRLATAIDTSRVFADGYA